VSFASLETLPIARSLAQIADQEDDLAEVYLERVEEVAVAEGRWSPGLSVRREQGFAVRLVRGETTCLAARDGFSGDEFAAALRQAARALPAASYTIPRLEVPPAEAPISAPEVLEFDVLVRRAVSRHHVAFPLRIDTRRHRREVQIIGTRLVPDTQSELYYSCRIELPWGVHGAVLPALDAAAADRLAASLVARFRGSKATTITRGVYPVVLGPSAAAVFLHEAVAHALETDTLSLEGPPEAAIGVELGSAELNVLDDPGGAPSAVRRDTDDEGMPVVRRWLLFAGRVRQPLADRLAARTSNELIPGAGRRSNRYLPPVPRSTHLELLPGAHSAAQLLEQSDGGLYLPEAARGSLDPHSGEFRVRVPYAYRIRSGRLGELVGGLEISGRVAALLGSVTGVGADAEASGAGWCAKGGQRLPVWATTPALALTDVEVDS
jgi:predicted Zn-dependent protease